MSRRGLEGQDVRLGGDGVICGTDKALALGTIHPHGIGLARLQPDRQHAGTIVSERQISGNGGKFACLSGQKGSAILSDSPLRATPASARSGAGRKDPLTSPDLIRDRALGQGLEPVYPETARLANDLAF